MTVLVLGGRIVSVAIGRVTFNPTGELEPLRHRLAEVGRRSGMAVFALKLDPVSPTEHQRRMARLKRLLEAPDPIDDGKRTRAGHNRGLPSYTEARLAPLLERPGPGARPASTTASRRGRTDREPGRRRARSRDFARTGRRRP